MKNSQDKELGNVPICEETVAERAYQQEQLVQVLISDLVKLAMEGHDLILKCNVPGEYTKEAYSFMEKCSGVFNTFVQHPDGDTDNTGKSS